MWIILMSYVDNEYKIEESGFNIVPQKEYDKVLPTTEQIAKQIEKIYFDGSELHVKEGCKLLSIEELNSIEQSISELDDIDLPTVYDVR